MLGRSLARERFESVRERRASSIARRQLRCRLRRRLGLDPCLSGNPVSIRDFANIHGKSRVGADAPPRVRLPLEANVAPRGRRASERGGSMRWRELLECVEAEPGITPDAIAARMGVSTRSIRSFAREANERLGRAASLAKRRGGDTS